MFVCFAGLHAYFNYVAIDRPWSPDLLTPKGKTLYQRETGMASEQTAQHMGPLVEDPTDNRSTMGNQQSKERDSSGKPNTLKKKPSQADMQQQSNKLKNDPNDQLWVTAHLKPRDYGMENPKSTHSPAPIKRRPVATPAIPEDPDAITPAPPRFPPPPVRIDSYAGHSNVTGPAKPPEKYRYSELLDLDDLGPAGHVRSPSGQLLSVAQARLREDRPRSIRERQERIQEAVRRKTEERAASRLGMQVGDSTNNTAVQGKRCASALDVQASKMAERSVSALGAPSDGRIGNETECVGDSRGFGKAAKRRNSFKGKTKEALKCSCQ